MSTTRRGALGAAIAAPLLTRFTGTASADAAPDTFGTVSDGWIEVRWTRQAQAQLDKFGAVVEAVAPASLVTDAHGSAVRFPVRTGAGDPSLADLPKAQGDGALSGGIAIRTTGGTFQLTDLRSNLDGETASAKVLVNGIETTHASAVRCGLTEGALSTETVQPGKPMKVRLADVPLRLTPDLVSMYTAAFGTPDFTADTVLAQLTAEGTYHPPTK